MRALVRFLGRRIALKLTLTLVGFTGIAGTSVAIAKTLFVIFLIVFLVFLIAGLTVARRVG